MKKFNPESIIPDVSKKTFGIYNEGRQASIEDKEAAEFVKKIFDDIHNQYFGQYSTLKKKVNEAIDKKIIELIAKVKVEKTVVVQKLQTAKGEEKKRLQVILKEYELMDTEKEVEEMLMEMAVDESNDNFIGFILTEDL